ncbi:MAG TPA: ATP-binding protein, partial [Pirellulales bacterium]|nr:ATP-binding protein [Pirellulales bacterium]
VRRAPLLPPPAARAFPDVSLVGAYDALLARYMPPGLLIGEGRELLHVFGDAQQFLRVKPGRPSGDALDLLDDDLKAAVTGALQKARKDRQPVHYSGIRLSVGGREGLYRVSVEPVDNQRSKALQMFVSIVEMAEQPAAEGEWAPPLDSDVRRLSRDRIEGLEAELRYTKENLQATIEEVETSNEELQATNEELVASNEELQSTNEELHSVNEELYTVNAEHQKKISELMELHADLEALLTATEVGTIFLDHELRIRKFTPSVSAAFSLLQQDVGRRIDSFAHSILHERLVEDVEEVLRTGEPREREVRDRHGLHYLLRILPYQARKSSRGAVLTLVDVTALKKAESQLADAVRRRDQFLAMLSHELRNPLNAITSATTLLGLPNVPPDTARHAYQIIERQGIHMAKLLDELLDVSRMTQNKLPIQKRVFNLSEIVTDAVAAVQSRLDEGRYEFVPEIASTPLWVNGDPTRLQQALTNLLDNALKYTPAEGRIVLAMYPDGGEVVVRVKDTGIGVEPELLNRIFDLFVQNHQTLARSSGGMGVGLSMVRSIVELHGGHVAAHSAGAGTGSEFVIRLPRAAAPPQLPIAVAEAQPSSVRDKLVVIVEDDADNRDMLRALLESHGFAVYAASNGQEGILAIERFSPVAALVDIGLPGIDGYEVAEHVRRNLGERTYLVALTGYGQADDVQTAISKGFNRHVVKPLSREKLVEVLSQFLPTDAPPANAPLKDSPLVSSPQ